MSSLTVETAGAPCEAVFSVEAEGQGGMCELSTQPSMHDPGLWEEEGISFPLSQPEPPRRHPQSSSASVQRRRRSAACCSAPYVGAGQQSGARRTRCEGGATPVSFGAFASLVSSHISLASRRFSILLRTMGRENGILLNCCRSKRTSSFKGLAWQLRLPLLLFLCTLVSEEAVACSRNRT